jgi:hypothetical protein
MIEAGVAAELAIVLQAVAGQSDQQARLEARRGPQIPGNRTAIQTREAEVEHGSPGERMRAPSGPGDSRGASRSTPNGVNDSDYL